MGTRLLCGRRERAVAGLLMCRFGLVPRPMAVVGLVGGSLLCASGMAVPFDVFEQGSARSSSPRSRRSSGRRSSASPTFKVSGWLPSSPEMPTRPSERGRSTRRVTSEPESVDCSAGRSHELPSLVRNWQTRTLAAHDPRSWREVDRTGIGVSPRSDARPLSRASDTRSRPFAHDLAQIDPRSVWAPCTERRERSWTTLESHPRSRSHTMGSLIR